MEIAVDLYALVQAAGDAIIVADVEGRIVLWNPAAERLFGFTATEAVGSLLDLIIPARFWERHWRGCQTVMQTGQTRYGSQVLRVPALRCQTVMQTGQTRYGSQVLRVPALRKDGQRVSIAFTVALLHTPAGGLTGRVMRPGGRWRCPADQRACHLSAVLGSPRCEATPSHVRQVRDFWTGLLGLSASEHQAATGSAYPEIDAGEPSQRCDGVALGATATH